MLSELIRVLGQKMKMSPPLVQEAEAFLRQEGAVIAAEPTTDLSVIRDPDDRIVLAEAMAAGADVLVTGDRDLLDVASRLEVEVVSPRGFWEKLHGR